MNAITPDRLRNWARWLRYWSASRGRTPSLEGGYRSPQTWHAQNPRPVTPDAIDAWDVEVACRILPAKYHLVLKLHHVRLYSHSDIAEELRKGLGLRVYAKDVPAILAMANSLLNEALDMPAVVRMTRAQALVRKVLCAKPLTPQHVGV